MHIGAPVKRAARAFGLSKVQVAGNLKDHPTSRLRGGTPRSLLEGISELVDDKFPHLIGDLARERIAAHAVTGGNLVVDGVRTREQAAAMRKLGAKIVRLDRGREPNPDLPMDMRQAEIDHDQVLDVTGSKSERRARIVQMLKDLEA